MIRISRMKLVGIVGIILVGVGYVIFLNSNSSTISIKVYPVQCPEPNVTDFSTCAKPMALQQSEYFLNKEKQTVIIAHPSEPSVGLVAGVNCKIVDSSNWSCGDHSSSESDVGFVNGNYFSGGWGTNNGKWSIIYVTESQWNSINNGHEGPF